MKNLAVCIYLSMTRKVALHFADAINDSPRVINHFTINFNVLGLFFLDKRFAKDLQFINNQIQEFH